MFLLPVFFLPVVVDMYGTGKNLFFVASALIGLAIWIVDLLISKKNTVKVNAFFWVSLLFLAWGIVTWALEPVGVQMRSLMLPMGLSTMVSMVIWLFLWIQVTDKAEYKKQFNFVMASGAVVAVTSLILFLLPASKLPISWPKANPIISISSGWSLVGSLLSETILLLFLTMEWAKRLVEKLKTTEKVGETTKPEITYIKEAVAVMLFGLVLFLDLYKMFKTGWVFLDGRSAWVIAVESLKTSPILGVGLGNYSYAFDFFRPASFNLTKYWNTAFSGSSMGILHIWTEMGLVGLMLMGWMTALVLKARKNSAFWQVAILWLVLLFLPLNLVGFALTIWLLSSLLFENKEIKLILNVGEKNFNAMPWILGVLLMAGAGFSGYIWTKILVGETYFRQSLVAASKNNGGATYDLQIKAISWNASVADYRRIYSQTNLSLAKTLLANKDITDEDKQKAATLIQQSVREAKAAIALDTRNPIYWSNLASIYKDLVGVVDGAADWSYQAYSQAAVLDPVNPVAKLDLGGLLFAANRFDEADRVFQQAVEDKSDYANAWYNWAYAAKKENRIDYAVDRLTNALKLVPVDSGDYDKANGELTAWKKELDEAIKKQQEALKQQQAAQEPKQPETLKAPMVNSPDATKAGSIKLPDGDMTPPTEQKAPQVTPTPVAPIAP